MSTGDYGDHTKELARTQKTIQACRTEIVAALQQQLPEAVIVACLVDSIVRDSAPPEVRLEFAAVINREVQAIATEWQAAQLSSRG